MKKMKKHDPKIKTVKYLELINQNKIWLVFNIALKVCKFPEHASSHSIINTFPRKFHISKVQTPKFRNLKFE